MSTTINTKVWDAAVGVSGSATLIGEVVCWSMHGENPVDKVRAAILAAGLDPKEYVPDFRHRNTIARVFELLEKDGRIIKQIRSAADAESISWQFNAARRVATCSPAVPASDDGSAPATPASEERYEFPFESIVTMQKGSGDVTCANPTLATYIATQMERIRNVRTAHDVTGIVQKMFNKRAAEHLDGDLFSVRDGGAVYFVMSSHTEFLNQVQAFMESIGGTFNRFPIPVGTTAGDKTVKDVVNRGLEGMIHEYETLVAGLNEASRPSTLEATAKKIETIREKIACYAAYLDVSKESLEEKAKAAEGKLRLKLLELSSAGSDDDEAGDAGTATDEVDTDAGLVVA